MIVVDASVANKLFLPNEEGYKKATTLFQNHVEKAEEICVLDLLFYEVANTLTTKTAIPLTYVVKSLTKLYALQLHVFPTSEESMKEASKLAKEAHVSVYDASYVILAQEKNCNLITADKKFAAQVDLPFIKYLGS